MYWLLREGEEAAAPGKPLLRASRTVELWFYFVLSSYAKDYTWHLFIRTFYMYLGHPVMRLQHKHLPQHISREFLDLLELHTCAGHGRPMVKSMGSTDSDPVAGRQGDGLLVRRRAWNANPPQPHIAAWPPGAPGYT